MQLTNPYFPKSPEPTDAERIEAAFTFTCKKCGSTNVRLHIEEGIDWGGQTGYQEGTISIGCNACQDNDIYFSI
jgi:hypothetical protein